VIAGVGHGKLRRGKGPRTKRQLRARRMQIENTRRQMFATSKAPRSRVAGR
jgi:hypothetical protein